MGHARNAARWLECRAKLLHQAECWAMVYDPVPNGEQAGYAVDDEQEAVRQMPPLEWLRSQPAYCALKARGEEKT